MRLETLDRACLARIQPEHGALVARDVQQAVPKGYPRELAGTLFLGHAIVGQPEESRGHIQ